MNNLKKFIVNGLVITVTSLLLRWIGVVFNGYISNHLGTEGMGIYTLVQTVFGFAVTFACSGINLGTTRIVSEAIAKNNWIDIKKGVQKSVLYSLFFSLVALVFLFFGASYIGNIILGDVRTVKSIKYLAISLPFISLSSVFNGYFSAVRKAYKNVPVMFFEKGVQIWITVKLFSLFVQRDLEFACVAVALGTVISEIGSFIYGLVLYINDIKKNRSDNYDQTSGLTKKLLGISLPLAVSSYARSGLITLEHLLIPYGLRRFGETYGKSMSMYGIIQGLVFPLLMFPSSLVYSFAGLIVPELAGYNELKQYNKINKAVTEVLRTALIFSIGVSGIILCFAYELSIVVYKSTEAYEYIKLFAPLVSVMYLDGAVDGVLKGLNEQLYSMKVNIADALISVAMVYFLIPQLGIKGYVIAIFVCEIFNCSMSLLRLVKICQPSFSVFGFVFKPIICISISIYLTVLLFDMFNFTMFASVFGLIVRILTVVLLYFVFTVYGSKKREFVFLKKQTQ